MKLKLGTKKCGDDFPPLMFAEEGQANQGDFNLAKKMINIASESGADGIEFQLFFADDIYIKNDPAHKLYLKREFTIRQIHDLINITKDKGLLFQATCVSPRLVDICANANVDVFCINATDLNNPFILDAVSSTDIPFWLATLMATIEEIDWAVNYLKHKGAKNFGLLHGQHVMSSETCLEVPPEIIQLDCIKFFKKRYKLAVGFVDHTSNIYLPSLAASKGANIIMKHLSPQENWKGPDWAVCLSPNEWKKSREILHYTALTFGNSKELSIAEIKDRSLHRRGIYTKRSLSKGSIITINDLIAVRPGKGSIDPRNIKKIIGKKVIRNLPAQYLLQENDLLNVSE